MDQPLYAVAKQTQWNFPEKYGERQFVIMFIGLPIEMAFLKAIGGWLEGSGWTAALTEANVAYCRLFPKGHKCNSYASCSSDNSKYSLCPSNQVIHKL